jgi:hypothetical protein
MHALRVCPIADIGETRKELKRNSLILAVVLSSDMAPAALMPHVDAWLHESVL